MVKYLGIELFLSDKPLSELHHWLIPNEFWKDVVGYEDYYMISSLGRLKSKDRIVPLPNSENRIVKGKFRKRSLSTNGYYDTTFIIFKKRTKYLIHRLVAIAFHRPIPGKLHVNHKSGMKLNSWASNLEWCTPKENVNHAIHIGLLKVKGEQNPTSKLKIEDVRSIRELLKQGLRIVDIASRFPVNWEAIHKIKVGVSWSHLD